MKKYDAVGKCIYCGKAKGLTDEHIIPFSLNGKWVLPKASCQSCAKITSTFEGKVANMFSSFRQSANLKTRRPKKRAKTVSLKSDDNEILQMPNEGMWDQIPTLQFQLPGIYRNNWKASEKWQGTILGVRTNTASEKKTAHWKKFQTKTFTYTTPAFDIVSYAKTLAKIAHCISVGHYGVDNFDHFLPPFILGAEQILSTKSLNLCSSLGVFFRRIFLPNSMVALNLSYFLGSFKEILPAHLYDHEFGFELQKSDIPKVDYLIYARIRLFPFAGGPTACIVSGKANQQQYQKCMTYLNNNQSPHSSHPLLVFFSSVVGVLLC